MEIAIASDHAGFELKEKLKDYLSDYDIGDFGAYSSESIDYPDTGFKASQAVANKKCDRGILICGSGIGMSIVANKVKGIRAALCTNVTLAKLSRRHNDANILILPGRFIHFDYATKIIVAWLNTDFDEGRHKRRIDKIAKYEQDKKI